MHPNFYLCYKMFLGVHYTYIWTGNTEPTMMLCFSVIMSPWRDAHLLWQNRWFPKHYFIYTYVLNTVFNTLNDVFLFIKLVRYRKIIYSLNHQSFFFEGLTLILKSQCSIFIEAFSIRSFDDWKFNFLLLQSFNFSFAFVWQLCSIDAPRLTSVYKGRARS